MSEINGPVRVKWEQVVNVGELLEVHRSVKYHLVDDDGTYILKDIPDESTANTLRDALNAQMFPRQVRCHRGHVTDVALWNCPVCTDHHVKENIALTTRHDEAVRLLRICSERLEQLRAEVQERDGSGHEDRPFICSGIRPLQRDLDAYLEAEKGESDESNDG